MKRFVGILLVVTVTVLILTWVRRDRNIAECTLPDEIIVGTAADFPPLSYMKEGAITGFDIEVAQEVVKRLGKKIVIKDMPFEVLLPQLQLGNIHMIAAGMTATDERAQMARFSKPYLSYDPLVILSKKETNPFIKLSEIAGKRFAVIKEQTADAYMNTLSKSLDMQLEPVTNLADGVMLLLSGNVDGMVTSANSTKPLVDQYGTEAFHMFVLPDTDENVALATAQNRPGLAAEVERVLTEMVADGTLESLKQKWHVH